MDTDKQTGGKDGERVEALPLAERVQRAEAFNAFQGIAPGWLVDARDTVNNWCVAEVLSVTANELKISYDGWTVRYDDVRMMEMYG